jgi:hypothetical protein
MSGVLSIFVFKKSLAGIDPRPVKIEMNDNTKKTRWRRKYQLNLNEYNSLKGSDRIISLFKRKNKKGRQSEAARASVRQNL